MKNGQVSILVMTKMERYPFWYYQRTTGARHAFQVVFDEPFVEADCFARTDPVVVPARTFFSQLV